MQLIFYFILVKMESNELKIDLYPDKKARYDFPKTSVESIITKDTLGHSLNKN